MRSPSGALAAVFVLAMVVAGCASPGPPGDEGGDEEPEDVAVDPAVPQDSPSVGTDPAAEPATSQGEASTPPAGSTSTTTPSGTPRTSSTGPAPQPGNSYRTLDVGGRQRAYILHVPPGLVAGQAVPLLVMLHPAMTSGSQVQYFYGLDAAADQHGFIVAYPDGTPEADPTQHTWNAGYCCGAGRDTASQDEQFIADLIEQLTAEFPIDADHVGLAGHSNGGMLAHRVAAARTDLVSSLTVVAGSIGGQKDKFAPILRPWTPTAPVDVLIVHATDDAVVAYEGGNPPGPFEPARIDLSVHDAVDLWTAVDGLSGEPVTTTAGAVVTKTWTGGLGGGSEVVFVTTEGGHGWPGVPGGQPPFFRSPAEPAATPLVAEFFMAHSR